MSRIDKKRVLILCTANSCRSQMAEGIARHLFFDRYEVFSAGVLPCNVNQNAITVMAEIGIDISHHRSKSLNEYIGHSFDYVMTVCGNADQKCPIFPGPAKRLHWPFEDPANACGTSEEILEEFRKVRDMIRKKFEQDWLTTLA
ncbi:arsenate reductase ArsC [bacterium]|nr:arsenate reductase ArsC [bacterium]